MKKLLLFITLVLSLVSCSKDNSFGGVERWNPKEQPLKIVTRVLTPSSTSFVQEFQDGSVIGMHIFSEATSAIYNRNTNYNNIKATASLKDNKISWHQSPEVLLKTEPVIVYAYYPYQPQTFFDVTCIPVKISADASLTNDYMYGTHATGQKVVNKVNPLVMLNMNHALALISFQISLNTQTSASYQLQAVQIGNKAGGTTLKGRGLLNLKTGIITGITDSNVSTRLQLTTPVELTTVPSKIQQLMTIPTKEKIKEGDVEVLFYINGKTYKYIIPDHTEWRKGYNYLYHLGFNGKLLKLQEVSFTNWTKGSSEKTTNSTLWHRL